jgi:hypothetical protein
MSMDSLGYPGLNWQKVPICKDLQQWQKDFVFPKRPPPPFFFQVTMRSLSRLAGENAALIIVGVAQQWIQASCAHPPGTGGYLQVGLLQVFNGLGSAVAHFNVMMLQQGL